MTPFAPSSSSTALGDWPAPLIAALERQKALVEELAALAGTQAALIAERHTDRLVDLLARRQTIIDEFTAQQTVTNTLTKDMDQRAARVAPAQREHIRGLIAEIGARLDQVMRRDQQDQAALQTDRGAVLAELSGLDAGRNARVAYQPAALAANRFTDHKG